MIELTWPPKRIRRVVLHDSRLTIMKKHISSIVLATVMAFISIGCGPRADSEEAALRKQGYTIAPQDQILKQRREEAGRG